MAEKPRLWIQEAIQRKGALRRKVYQRYGRAGFTDRGTIKRDVLTELAAEKGTTGKQARLAMTLRKF
jgi:hypothetical protein